MRLAWTALFCALAYGCSDGEQVRPDAGPTFGAAPDAGVPTREGPGIHIGDQGSPIPGTRAVVDDGSVPGLHGNHRFDTALWVEPDRDAPIANEHAPDQVDYFAFHAKPGFYVISTESGDYHPDNVITLYGPERELIASNDSGSIWPGDRVDARLVVRVPAEGDYYVTVEDLSTDADVFMSDFTLLYYHLTVHTVTAETPGFALWDGTRTIDSYLLDEDSGYRYVTVVGSAATASQSIAFAGLGNNALIAHVLPGGAAGDGSSVVTGHASVLDPSGALLADIDRASNQGFIRPPVGAGEHQLVLNHIGDTGSNPFFAIDLVLLKDNPRETNERANDTAAGAEPIRWSQGTRGRGLLLSVLPKGDVDYWAIPTTTGSYIGVVCEAQTTGSGVRGLTAELRDPNEQLVASGADVGQGLDLSSIVGSTGTYYLRLASTESLDALPWTRCVVVVG
jgi:hypothetical protein